MSAIKLWTLLFVSAGFLIGFSQPVYSASFPVEQIAGKPVKESALITGRIEKIGQDSDYIIVNGKHYKLSSHYVIKGEQGSMNEWVGESLSTGLLVEFILNNNLVETITVLIPM